MTDTKLPDLEFKNAAKVGSGRRQMDAEGYNALAEILESAFIQASGGKGHERHATNNPFEDQPIMQITRLLGNHPVAALAYQVIKKTVEAGRLYHIKGADCAERELLGAMNYAAAAILRMREMSKSESARIMYRGDDMQAPSVPEVK
jgi:hypothetical protein